MFTKFWSTSASRRTSLFRYTSAHSPTILDLKNHQNRSRFGKNVKMHQLYKTAAVLKMFYFQRRVRYDYNKNFF